MRNNIKLWAGVGVYLLVGAPASQAEQVVAETPAPGASAARAAPAAQPTRLAQSGARSVGGPKGEGSKAGEGAEGGEGGEAGGGPVKGAADYASRLLLMKGHLRIGRELYTQGDTANGLAHFLHPRSELYDAIAPALRERGAAAFDAELGALAEAAARKADWKQVQPAYERLIERIDAALGRVDAAERASPAFVITVAMALLQQAAREYGEAVKGGKFVNAAEYQDGRGFVLTAGDLLREQAPVLGGRNRAAYDRLMQQLAVLQKAWPSVVPPKQPGLGAAQVQAAVSRIELEASQLK